MCHKRPVIYRLGVRLRLLDGELEGDLPHAAVECHRLQRIVQYLNDDAVYGALLEVKRVPRRVNLFSPLCGLVMGTFAMMDEYPRVRGSRFFVRRLERM